MKSRLTFLAAACTLVLAACGKPPAPTETTTATPAPAAEPAPVAAEPAPVVTPEAAPAPAASTDKPAAVVANCATVIEGNDAMQFNVGSITIPASCSEFKITLNHTGKLPAAAMGHDVVITTMADMPAVAAEGMGAGAAANYVKADDARVIAHTKVIGGGESTSVSFAVSKLKGSGPYEFFCSFPGHSAMMKGTIAVQ
ncbi:MAG: azurin [Pseudoxanthomonas sp.]